jgi:hypothetical protein
MPEVMMVSSRFCFLQRFDILRQLVGDLLGLDVALRTDGRLHAIHAHFHGEAGDVIKAQSLEVLREKAEFVGSWLGGARGRETRGGE